MIRRPRHRDPDPGRQVALGLAGFAIGFAALVAALVALAGGGR